MVSNTGDQNTTNKRFLMELQLNEAMQQLSGPFAALVERLGREFFPAAPVNARAVYLMHGS